MPNPYRVDLVRRRLGLTKLALAAELGVDRKVLQRFEAGTSDLPTHCLSQLCKLSGYPSSFFDKGAVDFPSANAVSFRSLRSLTSSTRDAALAAGALAFELDDWISNRYALPDHALTPIEKCNPQQAAAFLRSRWGIGERPISNMINLLESRGVRVFSLAEETRHLDAYSFWRNNRPYVFLNTLKTAEHSRFDAAHELGHLVMHRHVGSSHPSAEQEAHQFASAFLMPPSDLMAELPRVRSLNDLIAAKRRWGVSVAALAYAMNKMGRITDWTYRGYCITLGRLPEGEEPNGIARETSQIWAKVLTDLWTQSISLSRIAQEISIPERELNGLLFGIASSNRQVAKADGNLLKAVT